MMNQQLNEYLIGLDQSTEPDPALVGMKAAVLSQLIKAGFAVPHGFLISRTAYDAFVQTNQFESMLHPDTITFEPCALESYQQLETTIVHAFQIAFLPTELMTVLEQAYQQIAPNQQPLIVRSSALAEDLAQASFAGMYTSVLNIQSFEAFIAAIKQCWASLWTARAGVYRAKQGLNHMQHSMALIVQPMLAPDCAGVVFTRHPLASYSQAVLVNAAAGLGQAVVDGAITPTALTLDRQTCKILHQHLGNPAFNLDQQMLHNLVTQALAIEAYQGCAQDIEWAIVDRQLWILQARPITMQATAQPQVPGNDSWFPDDPIIRQPYDLWTRANFGEVVPNPITPLTLSGFRQWGLRFQPANQPEPHQLSRRIHGRLYANEGAMRQIMVDLGMPTALLNATWGSRRPDLPPFGKFRPWRLLKKLPGMLKGIPKLLQQSRQTTQPLPASTIATFKLIDQWLAADQSASFELKNDAELWQLITECWEERYFQMLQRHSQVSQQSFAWTAMFQIVCRLFKGDSPQILGLMTGISQIQSAAMGQKLQAIAHAVEQAGLTEPVLAQSPAQVAQLLEHDQRACLVNQQFQAFLKLYGHHCLAEAELLVPRWAEEPADLIHWLQQYLRMSLTQPSPPTTKIPELELNLSGFVAPMIVRRILNRCLAAIRLRDNSRFYLAKLNLQRRKAYAELGQRWFAQGYLAHPDLIFFLVHADIATTIQTGQSTTINQLARERQAAYQFWCTQPAPMALDWQDQPLAPLLQVGSHLQGLGASPGIVEGTIRILEHPHHADLLPDTIIVTRSVDPSWTPLFGLVKGLILEIGGQLSHGAIVAREYGIPAVVNVAQALTLLQDGERIRLDGSLGIIYRNQSGE